MSKSVIRYPSVRLALPSQYMICVDRSVGKETFVWQLWDPDKRTVPGALVMETPDNTYVGHLQYAEKLLEQLEARRGNVPKVTVDELRRWYNRHGIETRIV